MQKDIEGELNPVVTRYGIVTPDGTLQLSGATFPQLMIKDGMPAEITVDRVGDVPASSMYVHTDVPIEMLRNDRDHYMKQMFVAQRTAEHVKQNNDVLRWTLEDQRKEIAELRRPLHVKLFESIQRFLQP